MRRTCLCGGRKLPRCPRSSSPDTSFDALCYPAEQDRDAVIAVVEDARAAQEREAERLRDKLSGFGKTLTPLAPRTNGNGTTATGAAGAAATANGGSLREFSFSEGGEGGRDDLVDSAEVRSRLGGRLVIVGHRTGS